MRRFSRRRHWNSMIFLDGSIVIPSSRGRNDVLRTRPSSRARGLISWFPRSCVGGFHIQLRVSFLDSASGDQSILLGIQAGHVRSPLFLPFAVRLLRDL